MFSLKVRIRQVISTGLRRSFKLSLIFSGIPESFVLQAIIGFTRELFLYRREGFSFFANELRQLRVVLFQSVFRATHLPTAAAEQSIYPSSIFNELETEIGGWPELADSGGIIEHISTAGVDSDFIKLGPGSQNLN